MMNNQRQQLQYDHQTERRVASCAHRSTSLGLILVLLASSCSSAFQIHHHHHHHRQPFTTSQSQTIASKNLLYTRKQQQPLAPLSDLSSRKHPSGERNYRQSLGWELRAILNGAGDKDGSYDYTCDVLVLGSGPAARCIAALLSAPGSSTNSQPLDVILADQNADREFVPNYGVWADEWQAVVDRYQAAGVSIEGGDAGLALNRRWEVTDCYFGGSFDIPTEQRMRLDRPYCQVDKKALRQSFCPGTYQVLKANHQSRAMRVNLYAPAGSLVHDETGSTLQLVMDNDAPCTIRAKLIVDCTGHETSLVLREAREKSRPPGFQIAYGCLVDVDESNSPDLTHIGPYDKQAMTLFDYRTDHFDTVNDEGVQRKVELAPTFVYAMPQGGNQIFFEETSLVARPAVSFQECKDRCFTRLKHHGINVTKIHEEEFCYIPMGGALPAKDQRIVGLGGAAAMVHPSTGYHLCRCLMGASDVAETIRQGLASQENVNLDQVAASAYHALWSPENIRERNFAVFGGEFLMKQNVVGLRGFFDGFFRLPLPLWAGFLAGWPGLPNNDQHESWLARLWYGLNFIVRIPPPVALDMAGSIISYTVQEGIPLAQSVTPFLGKPASYEYVSNEDRIGDVAAKQEARKMISESSVGDPVPVSFQTETSTSDDKKAVAQELVEAEA